MLVLYHFPFDLIFYFRSCFQFSDESSDSDDDDNADDKYAENAAPMAKFDAKNRVSVRNLRIREDTAKFVFSFFCLNPS